VYINITDSEKGDNRGSSGQLVHYLDKENRMFLDQPIGTWFNGTSDDIASYRVRTSLDSNVAKLGRDDAKFFLINISPSQKEIAHLKKMYKGDLEKAFKQYATKVIDGYAENFNRPNIKSNEDLMWFGKLEHHRYYSYKDKEVKSGEMKAGEVKPGDQMHIQIIVSRKNITNSIKLSPMNTSRGKNAEHSKKLGQFDRSAFKQSGEMLFDKQFDFERKLSDTFHHANMLKNGNLAQRKDLYTDVKQDKLIRQERKQAQKQGKPKEHTYLKEPEQLGFLKELFDPEYNDQHVGGVFRKKKKRKKGKGNDFSQGMNM
jgi:hypothetical protein